MFRMDKANYLSKSGRLALQSEVRNRINWNQVYYFSEVASCGSLKVASDRLGLSPSTLSEHIAQLEKDLQIQLFYRQHRKLTLTGEGNRLYLHAKTMFESGQRLFDAVSPIPLGSYPISIGLVPNPCLQVAYQFVGDFLKKFGPLNMKLKQASYLDLESGLAKAEFDFCFSDRKPERKDIFFQHVVTTSIRFYVSSKLATGKFSELIKRLPLLICNADPKTKSLTEQNLDDADFSPSSVVTSDYPGALLDLCGKGLGIGAFAEDPRIVNLVSLKGLRNPTGAPQLQSSLFALWSKDGENTEAVRHLKVILPKR